MTAAGFQDLPEAEFAFDHDPDHDPHHDLHHDPDHDFEAARFDDSDGAYAVAEPDPFNHLPAVPLRRPVLRAEQRAELRAELASQQRGAISLLTTPALPPLPAPPALRQLLPDGLRRGSTVAVTSSVSLLLALLGPASAAGAWTAMVGMPAISAEAAVEAGIELERLAIISPPEPGWTGSSWATAVGALLDAVDVVVARPGGVGGVPADADRGDPGAFGRTGGITDGDARRLTARARSKGGILVLFGQQAASWPAVEIELSATHDRWVGIDRGYGRLRQRQLRVAATGRGRSARPRGADLWL